jgi:hypothetical protein
MPDDPSPNALLSIYLNDHLAGSMVGLGLARRGSASNQGTEVGRALAEVGTEIEAEQAVLRRLMKRLDIAESRVKPAGAWLAEKLGRLKLNGQLRGYSPLSRVVELEGLCTGVTGKMLLWQAMERTFGSELPGFDFAGLAEQAHSQRQRLEAHRLDAAKTAFGSAAEP